MSTDAPPTFKPTLRDILRFINAANDYFNAVDPEGVTRLTYAVRRVIKQAQRIHDEYMEKLEDLRVLYALAEDKNDEKSALRKDAQGEFCYTREATNHIKEKQRELLKETHGVEPHIAPSLRQKGALQRLKLHPAYRNAFEGFVLPVEEEPDEEGGEKTGAE